MFMRVAVVGSRAICVENIGEYLPDSVTEIISGGAIGVDSCAREYAQINRIKLTELYPEYSKYGRAAPIKRNIEIIEKSDIVIALWDGQSRGTKFVIDTCRKMGVEVRVFILNNNPYQKEKNS